MSIIDTSRRRFLSAVTNLVLAIIGVLVLLPAIRYLLAPLWRRRDASGGEMAYEDAGPVSDIPIGEWRLLSLEVVHQDAWRKTRTRHSIWVRREGEGDEQITVLSPICPHLGCPINWYSDKREFICPCHGGTYDSNGHLIGGPPPRSMDPLDFQVRAGRLWVRWQDFKIGVRDRVPVNV